MTLHLAPKCAADDADRIEAMRRHPSNYRNLARPDGEPKTDMALRVARRILNANSPEWQFGVPVAEAFPHAEPDVVEAIEATRSGFEDARVESVTEVLEAYYRELVGAAA